MGFWSKLTILVLVVLAGFYIKTSFFEEPKFEKKLVTEEQIIEEPIKTPEPKKELIAEEKKQDFATVYFLGVDSQENSLFKTAKREVPADANKLKFALQQLIQGPTAYEKKQGVYSEIPKSTKLRGVTVGDNIVIDMSSDLVNGGGADSLYSRIKQIIKTSLANAPKRPIYLYIDGKQADVIGGEGIMLTQPLNENSLDE